MAEELDRVVAFLRARRASLFTEHRRLIDYGVCADSKLSGCIDEDDTLIKLLSTDGILDRYGNHGRGVATEEAPVADERAERTRSSDPREALRRLREAHEECEEDFCTLEKRTLLALLDVAAAFIDGQCPDCPPWGHSETCQRVRAALARLGEE